MTNLLIASVQIAMLNKKRPLKKSSTGLTLIEVLISLVITLVLFMALMQSALLSISVNTSNVLRDEAVRIAYERMNEARSLPFDNLTDDGTDANLGAADCPADFITDFGTTGALIQRDIRNISDFDFCTNRDITDRGADNREVVITVGWVWQGEDRTHSVLTLVRRP